MNQKANTPAGIQPPIEFYKVPAGLLQAAVDILVTMPYSQVSDVVNALRQVEGIVPAGKPDTPTPPDPPEPPEPPLGDGKSEGDDPTKH
jgi:hypothetical protein